MADMYPKCGDTCCLSKMFEEMLERNAVTWNAMIGGCIVHGNIKVASGLFERMGEGLQ